MKTQVLNEEGLSTYDQEIKDYIKSQGMGVTLEEVAQYNLDKLHKRYHGNHFNKEDSIHRNEEKKD